MPWHENNYPLSGQKNLSVNPYRVKVTWQVTQKCTKYKTYKLDFKWFNYLMNKFDCVIYFCSFVMVHYVFLSFSPPSTQSLMNHTRKTSETEIYLCRFKVVYGILAYGLCIWHSSPNFHNLIYMLMAANAVSSNLFWSSNNLTFRVKECFSKYANLGFWCT